jgi:hypothetical protein
MWRKTRTGTRDLTQHIDIDKDTDDLITDTGEYSGLMLVAKKMLNLVMLSLGSNPERVPPKLRLFTGYLNANSPGS